MSDSKWQWENATAGAVAGFATVAAMHPLDVVRTRFQVNDGRVVNLPTYKNTAHALLTIARLEVVTYSIGYSTAKQRYSKNRDEKLSPGLHLASAAEAGALQVSHGAVQFTTYEELRKVIVDYKAKQRKEDCKSADADLLNSVDYAILGGSSKIAAIILTYPFQVAILVIRSRLQQRPSMEGTPRYMDSWHVMKETARFEGFRGFYKGITPNLLKNVPASSITFIVYENVLKLLKLGRTSD
ncbi:unnamed protein product [Dovyalis caffra]|uniref:Uncharacterized protein n=1 Tax=Dovyalis caffra TaxID=77055 RepID=A0AAV1RHU1_9ROSI|nr:unnamed protein product [Dovyalis caffra]